METAGRNRRLRTCVVSERFLILEGVWDIFYFFCSGEGNGRFRGDREGGWSVFTLRLLNALNSEDRGLKVRFSLATIAFDRESAQKSQILSSQGKNAPSNPYPHYLVRLATSRY